MRATDSRFHRRGKMTEAAIRSQKGMTSVKEMPILQDGPPPGGFPAVRYARRIPNSGPGGAAVFLVSSLIIGFGFYQVGQGNIYRRYLLLLLLSSFKTPSILRPPLREDQCQFTARFLDSLNL